jgi:hypothetical protein
MEQTLAITALWVELALIALMISTGLSFGTISVRFDRLHIILTQGLSSHLIAVIISSALVPPWIAGAVCLPRRLLTRQVEAERAEDAEAASLRRRTEPPGSLEES